MDYTTFQNVVRANMPYDTGNMYQNGVAFFDTPYYYVAIYNTNQVPYIVFQEEGTRFFSGNKGFISKRTVGQILRIEQSEALGLPYDYRETNTTIANRNIDLMLTEGIITKE